MAVARRAQVLAEMLGDGRDMAGRAPGGDQHVVGQTGLASEIDGDDFGCLVVIE
jgi:hypothetical protein